MAINMGNVSDHYPQQGKSLLTDLPSYHGVFSGRGVVETSVESQLPAIDAQTEENLREKYRVSTHDVFDQLDNGFKASLAANNNIQILYMLGHKIRFAVRAVPAFILYVGSFFYGGAANSLAAESADPSYEQAQADYASHIFYFVCVPILLALGTSAFYGIAALVNLCRKGHVAVGELAVKAALKRKDEGDKTVLDARVNMLQNLKLIQEDIPLSYNGKMSQHLQATRRARGTQEALFKRQHQYPPQMLPTILADFCPERVAESVGSPASTAKRRARENVQDFERRKNLQGNPEKNINEPALVNSVLLGNHVYIVENNMELDKKQDFLNRCHEQGKSDLELLKTLEARSCPWYSRLLQSSWMPFFIRKVK